MDLRRHFGQIDVYLFDQLLRGRIAPGMRVVDAGCGGGRNLIYLLNEGFAVCGADASAGAIDEIRRIAATVRPEVPAENFRVESLEAMSFPDACAEVVLCSAVLHFARDDAQFEAMLRGAWRVLTTGGLFFCRLASSIGMESRMKSVGGRRFRLPDGSERYLADEAMLMEWTRVLGGQLIDPLKTTVVQDQRCMTTWVMRKG